MKQNQTNDSGESYCNRVVAVVVTYNPNLMLFEKCLASIREQVYKIIIVDNASKNVENIIALSRKYRCDFIENGFNAGVPYALKRGVEYSLRYAPTWILFLDQDSVVYSGAVTKVLKLYDALPNHLKARIGILALGQRGPSNPCKMREVIYHTFSGTLIKASMAAIIPFRINFFLDQADFDLYSRVREYGFKTILVECKLMDHRIGAPINIPVLFKLKKLFIKILNEIHISNLGNIVIPDEISKFINYENPQRFYYIVRNSLILLREKRKDVIAFVIDILRSALAVLYVDGFKRFLHSFILGLAHGLIGKEGYLKIFDDTR
jgi:rhamnosyltransferase